MDMGLNGDLKRKLAVGAIALIMLSGIIYQLGIKLGFWGQFGSGDTVTIVDEESKKGVVRGGEKGGTVQPPEQIAKAGGEGTSGSQSGKAAPGTEQPLVIHIVGAVEKPGVYYLPKGSRIHHAVDKAVARKDAALGYINLAQPLQDGEQVVVPGQKEVAGLKIAAAVPGSAGANPNYPGAAPAAGGRQKLSGSTAVNINTANQEQLDALPGIGPALAQRIIEFRETNGPFKSVQDLQKVPGIGAKKFEQLLPSVVIR